MIVREAEPAYVSPQYLAVRWNVTERTIQKWIAAGVLPASRLGVKLIRIDLRVALQFERRERLVAPHHIIVSDSCSS